MIPIGTLFRRHLRTVRDLAVRHDKIARLEIEGEDAELDTTVIEQLRDPLAHMVRNAIAHGIESPADREAQGKDPCGCIVLR
ncbi:MAG: chemotaxis protein CheA, partial [Myxococcales bacterium]|nr:chemotaxis protein CheA [Myxococcales bacterium]